MKSRITLIFFSYCLLFNACMVDNFEEGALLLDSITEVRLSSNDTLFLKKDGTFEIRYALRYFSKQGEVNFRNTVRPKFFLNGIEVDKAEIDLSQEASYILQAEVPNNPKLLSNELNIQVLSLINAIKEIHLEFIGQSNILIAELDEPTFEDLFRINLLLVTGERMVVNENFFDFEFILNGSKVEAFKFDNLTLGETTEVQIGINDMLSNVVGLEVLTIENAINEIAIDYLGESNILIPELQEVNFEDLLGLELTLVNGAKLKVGKSDFDFEFLLNGKAYKKLEIEDFELGKVTELKIAINEVVSNAIQIEVLRIKDAVSEIEITLIEGVNQINKAETKGLITDFIKIEAELKNSMKIDLKKYPEIFQVIYNEIKLLDKDIANFPDGRFKLSVQVAEVRSNFLDFEIFDPMTYIKRIDLVLDERTRNIYAVAGSSKLDFTYEVIGMDESVLSIPASLVVDGKKQDSFRNVPITKAGMVQVHAEISGKKSNSVQIISRQDQVLPKIRVPIVFHVLDNLNKNITKSVIDFEMEKLNLAFANQFELDPFMPKSSNAVNIHMEFYLADRDEAGNLLSQRGINRYSSGGQTFGESTEEERIYLFQRMWDPRKYVNVFVGRMDRLGGYAYLPFVKDIDLPGIFTIDNDYVLHYPYVTVMSDNAMGEPNNNTLAHEIGHMLALYHTFDQNTNGFQCIDGDYCPDTETHLIDATNSLFVSTSNFMLNCQEETFISVNIMDYIQKSNSFTFDQRARMRTAAIYSPFFAKEGNYTNARLRPLEKGPLDHSIQPVFCPNQNHFGRRFHHH
ncbi:M43 family zinc metalloprotease [Cecembia lonarensis]|uniref:Zinc-dependent metalloproteinase lipoprotein, family n=1 Tax=Cecembia lonarensis (strain CCUG 58316 / KCTC 22772 / LW9) TaxID=1225176 RepID=K1LAC3_CECL9|nr:M43 family zinc metalloprotease [Cecembia lonarensis]EKB47328.1 zinc-dependent metalloproteinase lipoprotein, family [Cecembia lonarensis LW9]